MDLGILISQIQSLDGGVKLEADKAVNRLLTIRNWLIGYYIVEYEQNGTDRAKYGENLLNILSSSLGIKGLSVTNLKLNRSFYVAYPQIGQTLSDKFILENNDTQIRRTVSDELKKIEMKMVQEPIGLSYETQLVNKMVTRLSFSHIVQLVSVNDPIKRAFYAIEAMKGTWSVRELKRQINSLLFERSNISRKPEHL